VQNTQKYMHIAFYIMYNTYYILVGGVTLWLGRRSLAGGLSVWLTCGNFVRKLSAMGHPTRPTQPSISPGSVNE